MVILSSVVSAYLMMFFAKLKNGGLTSLKGSGLNVKSSITNFFIIVIGFYSYVTIITKV